MRTAVITIIIFSSYFACKDHYFNTIKSIALPVIPNRNVRMIDTVNKDDVKNLEYIVDINFPAEEVIIYYKRYFEKLGFSNKKVIFYEGRKWNSYEDATKEDSVYILKRCDEWTDERSIYIGFCMWYESSNISCLSVYNKMELGMISNNEEDKTGCNLSNLHVTIQATYLSNIGINEWKNME